MTIFSSTAPLYWAAGLPAIPLMVNEKRPAIQRWQIFADAMPTDDEKNAWLSAFPDGNIGLPMGASSGLVAIDIDTDDAKVLRVLDQLLPPTPWVRVGRKGMVRIYRFSDERTTRIKSADGMVCEILSKGTQIVLPPSIHPDTGRPYTANSNLPAVLSQVVRLPPNIGDLIRGALKDIGIDVTVGNNNKTIAFVPAGARDSTMVWQAGLMARAVMRGERALVQVLGEMEQWVNSYVEKVVGDPLDPMKAKKKIIEFLIRDVTGERRQALPVGWDEGLSPEEKEKLGLNFTEDNEKWSTGRILSYLQAELEQYSDPNSDGFRNATNLVLDRVARSEGEVSALDEERILKVIQSQSNGAITIGALKKQVVVLRRGDIAGENHEEVAQAVIKNVTQYGDLRFDAGKFWQWNGSHWAHKEDGDLMKVIATDFGFYPACRRYSDYQGVLKVMKDVARRELRQSNLKGLNFANGFLAEDLVLREHNPDYGMIYTLPYRYMPEISGHMPMFNQYLADSWSEDSDYMDKVAALQEIMGASLFAVAPRYQRAVCLFGQPGSGKSRVPAILRGLLPPEAVCSIPPTDWNDKFLPADMFGKVMNFAGELSESKAIPGDIFKLIVEGEQIAAQFKNQTPFSFRPACAHWFASNHLPKTRDSSDGFNRRWLILEWNKRVDPAKKIVDLDQIILENEREAIVAWAVLGFERLTRNQEYTLPSSHMACVDQMAADNNSVRYFLASCPRVIVGETRHEGKSENEITLTDLHSEYWSFCLATGIAQRAGLKPFQRMMKELQPVFGFQEEIEMGRGQPLVKYQYITLAKNK